MLSSSIMWVVASTLLFLAATSTLPLGAPPPGSGPSQFPNEEALRRYAQGRLHEERGEADEALGEFYRVMLLDSRAANVARRISELAASRGDAERSLEFADRALTIEPGNARGLWLKGAALFNLGRTGESLDALLAAVAVDSSEIEYLQTLAKVAEQLDRIEIVARAYGRAAERDEDDGESWFQLAAARARLRDFAGAEAALDRATDLSPARPGLFFLRGWIREGRSDPLGAIELYRQHLAIHGADQVTRRRLINLLSREKRFSEAYSEAQKVSRAHPDDPEVLEVEADLAFRARHAGEGRALVERMSRSAGDDPDELMRVIAILIRNDRAGEGVALADRWQSGHSADCRGWMLAARARAAAGQADSAIVRAVRAVDGCPDSLSAHLLLGGIHQANRHFEAAARAWTEAARRFPDNIGVRLDLAFCREQQGDIDGAQTAARDALALEPDNPQTLNFLGYLLADHDRDLAEAVHLVQRALEKEPDNGSYVDSMGWAYYRLGKLDEARVQLERAIHLTGGDPVIYEHLGDVYKDLRLFDLAREQYRRSLALDGSNDRVRSKLSRIR